MRNYVDIEHAHETRIDLHEWGDMRLLRIARLIWLLKQDGSWQFIRREDFVSPNIEHLTITIMDAYGIVKDETTYQRNLMAYGTEMAWNITWNIDWKVTVIISEMTITRLPPPPLRFLWAGSKWNEM